ncbi:MAG: (2Fe-2S)-binding protein [Bdellovibrionales bacterium RIFOXYD1_FULL_44_7]|nr:MAG: (2Fe-2S)-binding protein [Bdellovibrionales bacterium RIFOXYD1_FULL_44_7]
MKHVLRFLLNGEKYSIEVEPNEILLDVIREKIGIKSPKAGCERGDCGSCTVLLNGNPVRSCLVLAVEVDGQEVTTIEGLSKDGLTELQKAFHNNNSFQCGYCAPGMVLSATELLERNHRPSDGDIKEAIAGNLCRCTGYTPIIDAIRETAKKKR